MKWQMKEATRGDVFGMQAEIFDENEFIAYVHGRTAEIANERASLVTSAVNCHADLLAALEALVGWQDKLSLSDRHATADQARAWSLDCRNARAEVAKAKGVKK